MDDLTAARPHPRRGDPPVRRRRVRRPGAAIAQDAGVSPGLVLHHFGTKDALRAACDEHVLRQIREDAEGDRWCAARRATARAARRRWSSTHRPSATSCRRCSPAATWPPLACLERLVPTPRSICRPPSTPAGCGRAATRPPAPRYLVYVGIGALLVHSCGCTRPPTATTGPALRVLRRRRALPALELYTEGLLTDRSMLDAYLHAPAGGTLTPLTPARTTCPAHPPSRSPASPSRSATSALSTASTSRRPGRQGRRLPRAQRRRQVDHHPRPARPAPGRRRHRPAARRRPVGRRGRAAPAARLRPGRRDAVAQPHRRRGDRPARPAARRARPAAPGRAAGALRARPDQEGPHLLEGQPAEGRAGRRAGRRRGAARCSTSRRRGSTR